MMPTWTDLVKWLIAIIVFTVLIFPPIKSCNQGRSRQWRRQGEGGSFPPVWVDVQKLCNMCVLSLSWNFFVSHDKYIARPSSKEPR